MAEPLLPRGITFWLDSLTPQEMRDTVARLSVWSPEGFAWAVEMVELKRAEASTSEKSPAVAS